MNSSLQAKKQTLSDLEPKLNKVCKKIAPLWSLENFVAVNPYLGLSEYSFEEGMFLLAQRGNIKGTLPTEFYLKAISDGKITKSDIQEALISRQHSKSETIEEFLNSLENTEDLNQPKIKTIIDLSEITTGKNWKRFMIERISDWSSTYFDETQAAWKTSSDQAIFKAWKDEASVDKSTELTGLKNFRTLVKALPDQPIEAAQLAIETLHISENMLEAYLHKLLLNIGGWSAYVARIDWDKGLAGQEGNDLTEFLAILLSWELIVYQSLSDQKLERAWYKARLDFAKTDHASFQNTELEQQLVLQSAFDLANQRQLIKAFDEAPTVPIHKKTPKVQAIFCIDVRSEVYRRHLEITSPEIATMGFAGFFAFPVQYVPLGHDHGQDQCPVLLTTSHTIKEKLPTEAQESSSINGRKLKHQIDFAWKSFKLGAISCFSFVGPIGLSFLPKLFTDSFGFTRPVSHPDEEGLKKSDWNQKEITLATDSNSHSGIPLDQQMTMAEGALKAMSLTSNFANLVLIVGHGSSSVNNPHATGLDCGACGGHTGEANAKVAAAVLNNPEVRKSLINKGIMVPDHTTFVACQHDTTTDEVTLFNEDKIPAHHSQELIDLKNALKTAGKTARTERALRMNIHSTENVDKAILQRSKDWSQVRPEWGLAGCSAFVVAPRERSMNLDLGGKSFLHSYDWEKDTGFGILELIMTAPMVVTSWINLQYYASTVDNKTFGSGNKALHNVVAGLGVLEGHSGDLRSGLPWQSVHDGVDFQHEPLRLNVIIEAPIEAMNNILEKNEGVRQLVDNEWIFLFSMNNKGKVDAKYSKTYGWTKVA